MTVNVSAISGVGLRGASGVLSPAAARTVLLLILLAGAAAGVVSAASPACSLAVSHAGTDLTRLLRFMAVLKAAIAVTAAAVVFWRLGVAVSLPWLAAYGVAVGAMAAGPGLIWAMVHVGLGALLLHGGLFATILLLWRDPATAGRMAVILARR